METVVTCRSTIIVLGAASLDALSHAKEFPLACCLWLLWFHVSGLGPVCRRCIAAHACLPLLQPATILDVRLELHSAHMGAHLAEQLVTGERMKAKPNESTHSQNLPANICPTLQLQAASLSHQSETIQLPFSGLFLYGLLELQVYGIFYVLQELCSL